LRTTPPLLIIHIFFRIKGEKLMVASFFGHKNILDMDGMVWFSEEREKN
jgi:hypothetical protein